MLSRWLLKKSLSLFSGVDIAYQQIQECPLHKPFISGLSEDIHFSLSHSKEWIVVSIDYVPTGIDIEYKKQRSNMTLMAQEFMSEAELKQFSTSFSLDDFYYFWCRKEAYYKALAKEQQQNFQFTQLDSLNLDSDKHDSFFDLTTDEYQLCSYHQQAMTEIDLHLIDDEKTFKELDLNSTKVHINLHQTLTTDL